ncbi:TVP38/TMEM64 family protein [Caulobacter sp. 17J80-11]|uniref:TVP38/TMEM64 family protein n=1 Tax=Caulobacter sp. 17J80-11 TaxID=2763502 RepID=UPI0016536510|nr:TVP38/TMEM64 family protein [Caulobacter sp. 17J80-11]MBC6981073.1 TVP38/TMEM64 family protein [Caulobacter sp. 17J80-11]
MNQLWTFLTSMDRRAWRAIGVTVGLFAAMAVVFMIGRSFMGGDTERELEAWLQGFADGPWGLPVVIFLFTASAFIGAPQFVLIAACVVAFGPWLGFLYSWVATVVSAAATFWVGRVAGARSLERFGGGVLNRMSSYVGKNAFTGSFIIRNVPSAPFIVVNMAFGVSRASFWQFLAGCALGVLPKTALVAFFGGSFMTAVAGDGVWSSAILAGIGLAWLAIMLIAREILRRRAPRTSQDEV